MLLLLLASTAAAAPPPIEEPPLALARLTSREVAVLRRELARLADPCTSVRPVLSTTPFFYSGCNRNVHRNSTVSVETCQNGTLTVYNASESGLFDVAIAANIPTHDVWHFVCTFNPEAAHAATCTLTYETPLRPEGPAWLQLNFDDVSGSPCRAGRISMIGTYFYDALTNDAGVYAFHATLHRT